MNTRPLKSIKSHIRKYTLSIIVLTAIGLIAATFIGGLVLKHNRTQHMAFETSMIEYYLAEHLGFYQRIVDNIARQQAVRDMIAFEDEGRAMEMAASLRKIIPNSIGVAFFSEGGHILGEVENLKVGRQCLIDLRKMLNTEAVSLPPVHREIPELSHFDITSPIRDEQGHIIGVVFVSFSLDVLKHMLADIEQPDFHVRLVSSAGDVISEGDSADTIFTDSSAGAIDIPGTDWRLEYIASGYDSDIPLLSAGGIFAVLGLCIILVSLLMSYRLIDIFRNNFEIIRVSLEDSHSDDTPVDSDAMLKDFEDVINATRNLIMKRNDAHKDLEEREKRYRILTEDNPLDVIWVLNTQGEYTYVNPAIEQRLGYQREELLGKSLESLLSEQSKPLFRMAISYVNQVKALPQESFEFEMITKDGDKVWVEAVSSLIFDDEGNLAEIMGISRDITQRKALERQLRDVAYKDALTGVSNRARFFDYLEFAVKRAVREQKAGGLMFIDLDRFKDVNDTHGHHVGDHLLQQVADRLMMTLREADIVARIGGDEFAVILSTTDSEAGILTVAEKIKKILSEPFLVDGFTCRIGASIGISIYPRDSTNPEVLLRIADQAMYDEKHRARRE